MKKIICLSLFLFLFLLPFQAEGEELTERVTVIFEDKVDEEILNEYGIEIHHIFEELSAASITMQANRKAELLKKEGISRIDPDPVVQTSSQTADWGYNKVKASQAKKWGWTGEGVKIGIIDTGISTKHPDLKVAGGATFVEGTASFEDDQGHGTHVAGIIGAQDNSIGVVGVAPDAEIYALKALDSEGEGNQSDIVAAIDWAIQNEMDVINLSVTSPQGSYLLSQTLQKAFNQGMTIVAASGNSLAPLRETQDVLFPARYPTVIAVGSINQNSQRSEFSYFGESLEFVAPGEQIFSTFGTNLGGSNEDYAYSDGTSMSAPFVSGIAALYKQAYPELDHVEMRTLMQQSALDLGEKGKDAMYGYGLVQPPFEVNGVPVISSFPDVLVNSWYVDEVEYLYEQEIVSGYPDGSFLPADYVTRAEAITMIGKALELSEDQSKTVFSDIPASHYASGYIQEATERQILTGYPDGTFKPGALITRGDAAVMLQRAYEYKIEEVIPFKDVPSYKYYYEAVHSLQTAHITTGYPDGTFKPMEHISRAEFSAFLARTLNETFLEK